MKQLNYELDKRCPVCGSKMHRGTFVLGPTGIEEDSVRCVTGCGMYTEYFNLGTTEITVGCFEVTYTQGTPDETMEAIREGIKALVAAYKPRKKAKA